MNIYRGERQFSLDMIGEWCEYDYAQAGSYSGEGLIIRDLVVALLIIRVNVASLVDVIVTWCRSIHSTVAMSVGPSVG